MTTGNNLVRLPHAVQYPVETFCDTEGSVHYTGIKVWTFDYVFPEWQIEDHTISLCPMLPDESHPIVSRLPPSGTLKEIYTNVISKSKQVHLIFVV